MTQRRSPDGATETHVHPAFEGEFGDEGYRRTEVSRETFNDNLLGECVKR